MTKPINPVLKQIVAGISSKANQGRITSLSWGTLNEARKKKNVKEGNMAPKKDKKPTDEPTEEKPADAAPEGDVAPKGEPDLAPDAGQGDSGPTDLPPLDAAAPDGAGVEPGADAAPQTDTPPEEDAGEVEADAAKAKAELEKAKAEKDQAEKDIKKHSYVNLVSSAGVHFLLGKLVDHAFKTNTIDSLASEMTGKLKIQTAEDFSNFSEEMAPFRGIPGVAELLAAMKGMATKQPDVEDAEPVAEADGMDDLDRELEEKINRL